MSRSQRDHTLKDLSNGYSNDEVDEPLMETTIWVELLKTLSYIIMLAVMWLTFFLMCGTYATVTLVVLIWLAAEVLFALCMVHTLVFKKEVDDNGW